jgi:hypothetical protein
MHPFKKKPQMTSEEFKTALREAGFGVAQGKSSYASGLHRSAIVHGSEARQTSSGRARASGSLRSADAGRPVNPLASCRTSRPPQRLPRRGLAGPCAHL